MPEELELPIKGADACPHCGSKERVLEKMIAKLKEEGKLAKESFPLGAFWATVLFDPARTALLATKLMIPVARVYYDLCPKCKTIYWTRVELIELPAQMQMPPQRIDPLGGRRGPRKEAR